jgi:hypothetical protein
MSQAPRAIAGVPEPALVDFVVLRRSRSAALAFSSPRMLNKADVDEAPVPTLLRFLAVIAVLAGLGFAAMFVLATFVEPESRDMSVTIPFTRLQPK